MYFNCCILAFLNEFLMIFLDLVVFLTFSFFVAVIEASFIYIYIYIYIYFFFFFFFPGPRSSSQLDSNRF